MYQSEATAIDPRRGRLVRVLVHDFGSHPMECSYEGEVRSSKGKDLKYSINIEAAVQFRYN